MGSRGSGFCTFFGDRLVGDWDDFLTGGILKKGSR